MHLRNTKNKIVSNEERLRLAIDAGTDGIWDWNIDTNEIYFSKRWKKSIGYEENEFSNHFEYWKEFIHPNDYKKYIQILDDYIHQNIPVFEVEFRMKMKSGTYKWFLSRGEAIWDSNGKALRMIGVHTDITQLKNKEEKIYDLAYTDPLTGLYNRTFLKEQLDLEVNICAQNDHLLGVMLIDLDDFKKINDNLGHAAGDKLLKETGQRLKVYAKTSHLITHIGGDEFALLLPEIKKIGDALSVAQEILDDLKNPFFIDCREIHISASIGISFYPKDGLDGNILIKNADISLYKAKTSGKNRFEFYSPYLNKKIEEEFMLENHLRHALEKNEFYIYYQPIVDILSQKIVGAEALLRWKHPKLGFISPDKFIPIAEEKGFILSIGEWILRNICIQNKKWRDLGYDLFISVNISVNQLKQNNFVKMVSKILEETGVDPKYIDLEITESISMENIDHIMDTIQELKALHVNLSMDDFGTGYSSLSQLKNLSLTKLKIDRSFTKDIHVDVNNTNIVSAIIAMAKNLNMDIIAEGVETKDQLEFFKSYDCNIIQGYLFSPPVDTASFEKMISDQRSIAKQTI